jgi:glutathione S-transferase
VPQSVAACYDLIEHKMLGAPWVMGDTYTICDSCLFTMAQWLEQDGVDPSRFPKVITHRRRMSERPEVQSAISEQLASRRVTIRQQQSTESSSRARLFACGGSAL